MVKLKRLNGEGRGIGALPRSSGKVPTPNSYDLTKKASNSNESFKKGSNSNVEFNKLMRVTKSFHGEVREYPITGYKSDLMDFSVDGCEECDGKYEEINGVEWLRRVNC